MDLEQVIINKGIARSMFVSAWADEMEEQGKSFSPGSEIMQLAPHTPHQAVAEAYRFTGRIEGANDSSLIVLLYKAAKADGRVVDEMSESEKIEYAESFGHYLLMESLGHGVSWFDSHQEFDLKIPDFENPMIGHSATLKAGSKFEV